MINLLFKDHLVSANEHNQTSSSLSDYNSCRLSNLIILIKMIILLYSSFVLFFLTIKQITNKENLNEQSLAAISSIMQINKKKLCVFSCFIHQFALVIVQYRLSTLHKIIFVIRLRWKLSTILELYYRFFFFSLSLSHWRDRCLSILLLCPFHRHTFFWSTFMKIP